MSDEFSSHTRRTVLAASAAAGAARVLPAQAAAAVDPKSIRPYRIKFRGIVSIDDSAESCPVLIVSCFQLGLLQETQLIIICRQESRDS